MAFDVPPDASEETREELSFLFGGVIYQLGDSLFGLRPVASDRFDENRVGLDHISFAVGSRADLERAVRHLDELDVAHEGIRTPEPDTSWSSGTRTILPWSCSRPAADL